MDQYPDQQLDTAYRAYLNNPNAANQTVQATAKGAPTGLQGLAAAAATHQFQTDQQAQQQQQMMAQQAQGQPPNVVQQLAMRTAQMPGIMGQLGPNMQLAGAPSTPAPQMPTQNMAGGGLVAFADGGLVIPYDVLEAIHSHFAQGGDVRGFALGTSINATEDPELQEAKRQLRSENQSTRMKNARKYAVPDEHDPYGQYFKKTGMDPQAIPTGEGPAETGLSTLQNRLPQPGSYSFPGGNADLPKQPMGYRMAQTPPIAPTEAPATMATKMAPFSAEAAPSAVDSWTGGEGFRSLPSLDDLSKMIPESVKKVGRFAGSVSPYMELLDPRVANPVGLYTNAVKSAVGMKSDLPGAALDTYNAFTGDAPGTQAVNAGLDFFGAGRGDINKAVPKEERGKQAMTSVGPDDLIDNADAFPKTATKVATTPPGSPPATPRVAVPPEAANAHPSFSNYQQDMPTTVTHPGVDGGTGGLNALMGGGFDPTQVRDMISELRGHQTMDPEISQKLADLEHDAQTNTVVQSLLGGLGAGLSSPYGGRFALGKAALGALSGFEQGTKSEEDLGKNAFNVLRGYKDAPALEQQKAADIMFGQMGKSAEQQSAERIAMAKGSGLSLADRMALKQTPSGMDPFMMSLLMDKLGLSKDAAALHTKELADKAITAQLNEAANATNRINPAWVDSLRRKVYAEYGVDGNLNVGAGGNTGSTGSSNSGIVLRNRPQ